MSTAGLGDALIPIEEKDLDNQRRFADALTKNADWTPRTGRTAGLTAASRLQSTVGRRDGARTSFEEVIDKLNAKDDVRSPREQTVFYAVRRALMMGFHLASEYRTAIGLEMVPEHASAESKEEMREKLRTSSAIALFSFASYLQFQLIGLATENEQAHMEHISLPEVVFDEPIAALKCAMYYLTLSSRNPAVRTPEGAATTAFAFAEKLLQEILQRRDSFRFTDSFESMSYGLPATAENEEFTVTGFERHGLGTKSAEFKRFDLADMVGNRDGKHMARREAQRLVCYNPRERKNPFMELGGLAGVWMGYGKPGTGKSLMASAIATLLHDYCEALGMEFHFDPLPDDIIDSYQGKSAQKMMAYMKRRQDPRGIRFMAVDDAENVLLERSLEHASEGNRAAVGVALRYLEGAYAITHGNVTMGILTNLPEQIDSAMRSRIQWKMLIDGASTVEDYIDQLRLYTRGFDDQDGFVNLAPPAEYEYFANQRALANLGEASETRSEADHPTIRTIMDRAMRDSDPTHMDFFGRLYFEVMQVFPAFSSRDVRNITSAIDSRIMDFDLPQEWFEDPEAYHLLAYERQRDMVLELRNANLGGLDFSDIKLQESIRYLDNYAAIANAAFDRRVDERLEQVRIEEAVKARLQAESSRNAGKAHA